MIQIAASVTKSTAFVNVILKLIHTQNEVNGRFLENLEHTANFTFERTRRWRGAEINNLAAVAERDRTTVEVIFANNSWALPSTLYCIRMCKPLLSSLFSICKNTIRLFPRFIQSFTCLVLIIKIIVLSNKSLSFIQFSTDSFCKHVPR